MNTQYSIASSMDGFIADPEHTLDWLMQFGEIEGTSDPAFIRGVGALAMGSIYEWLLRHEIRPAEALALRAADLGLHLPHALLGPRRGHPLVEW